MIQFNLRDISARKRMEEKMQRGEEHKQQSQKMEAVGRLASGVAHDFNNLLNARDAMPQGGTITITTEDVDVDESFSGRHPAVPVGRYVAITVKDTGTGMNEETRAHLFEPFFTTKPKGSGVGLGLSTTYNIVKQGGGYIWAYTELGVGSTFTVYLPLVEAEAAAGEGAPAAAREAGGTETILLVEDEAAVRSLARRFLERGGYRVLEAANGPDALRLSRQYKEPIQLMVTDVVMPRMSGRELAFQLANERQQMKVLYMSGHTEDAIIHHGVLQDEVAFLPKPFTQRSLAARVRALLDRQPEPTRASSAEGQVNET